MSAELKPCPFCGGEADITQQHVKVGDREYARTESYHVVCCKSCRAQGTRHLQETLSAFTSYGYEDFRKNPILRAEVQDEYDEYIKHKAASAVDSWNRRAGGE